MLSSLRQIVGWNGQARSTYSAIRGDELSEKNAMGSIDSAFLEKARFSRSSGQKLPRKPVLTVIGILSAIIVILTTLLVVRDSVRKKPWPVPEFRTITKTFRQESDWEYSPKADHLWNSVIPHAGLVLIEDWQSHGLNPGLESQNPNGNVYGVSVTHQYHCLNMIRDAFFGLASRNQTYIDNLSIAADFSYPEPFKVTHIFHCMDYLRQVIMCNADLTIEWRSDVDPEHIDGYGPPHQCREWDTVHGWLVGNMPPDQKYRHGV